MFVYFAIIVIVIQGTGLLLYKPADKVLKTES